MGRVSARNYVVQKRTTLLDFGIFWDLKPQKIRFFPWIKGVDIDEIKGQLELKDNTILVVTIIM